MSKPSCLITGAAGFVGAHLCRHLSPFYCIHAGYHRLEPDRRDDIEAVQIDLQEPDRTRETFTRLRPNAVVHLAGLTDADRCQREPDAAHRINVRATRHLASWSKAAGIPFIYSSTDLVFGAGEGWRRESDCVHPLGMYGRSKYEGEQAVQAVYPGALILRFPLLYGWGLRRPAGFFEQMIRDIKANRRVTVFIDQYRSPLYVEDVCAAIHLALEQRLSGLYHLSAGIKLSRAAFAELTAEVLDLPRELLEPVTLAAKNLDADRPHDCSLDPSAFVEATGWTPMPIRKAIKRAFSFSEFAGPPDSPVYEV